MDIHTSEINGVGVLRFSGSHLVASEVGVLKATFAQLARDRKNQNYIFELNGLVFIDSVGLGALIGCLKAARQQGGDIKLCGVSVPVYRTLELVKMQRVFQLFDLIDAAVSSFSAKISDRSVAHYQATVQATLPPQADDELRDRAKWQRARPKRSGIAAQKAERER